MGNFQRQGNRTACSASKRGLCGGVCARTARLWPRRVGTGRFGCGKLSSGKEMGQYQGHQNNVMAVAFCARTARPSPRRVGTRRFGSGTSPGGYELRQRSQGTKTSSWRLRLRRMVRPWPPRGPDSTVRLWEALQRQGNPPIHRAPSRYQCGRVFAGRQDSGFGKR